MYFFQSSYLRSNTSSQGELVPKHENDSRLSYLKTVNGLYPISFLRRHNLTLVRIPL